MYKKRGIYYTSIQVDGVRAYESLHTKDKKEAKSREPKIKNRLYHQIQTNTLDKRKTPPSDSLLVSLFLGTKKHLPKTTQRTYYYILDRVWLNRLPFPANPNTQISYKKHINAFYRWCNERYKVDYPTYKIGEMKGRIRVYNSDELNRLFKITDKMLARFIKASYYTGAREGELLRIKSFHQGYLVVGGKSYERIIKLSKQAQEVFGMNPKSEYFSDYPNFGMNPNSQNIGKYPNLWDYHLRYKNPENEIQKKFRGVCKELGIEDARFHDLRRTFGYNLIVQGMPIYQVSKLLGHKSVRTTERHYAPLLVTEVEDFKI